MPHAHDAPHRDGRVRPRSRLHCALSSRTLVALAAGILAGCGAEDPPALTAAGVRWTEDELLGLSPDRRLMLGELTAFATAVADGTLESLGGPRVDALRRDQAWRLLRASQVLDSAGIGDDVLRARYATEPEWELTVRHLLIMSPRYETDATRTLAREKAGRALERIRAGEDFPTVAAEVSEEPGAEGREGLLTPGREGSWVDEFWSAALALEPGGISGVVETEYGFHVLRLEDRRTVPFDEARPRVALDVAAMVAPLPDDAAAAPLPQGFELLAPGTAAAGDPAAGEPDEALADTVVVARWDGGVLTADTLRAALAGAPPGGAIRAAGGDEAVERVARAVAAGRTAAAAGLAPSESWEDEARREWLQKAEGWARLLGFGPGLGRAGVRDAATRAFEASGQNVGLAREELRRDAGGLLHLAYTIETPPAGGA